MNSMLKPKQILAFAVVSIFLSLSVIAAPDRKPYGLGLPISSGTGGAVRSANSLLVPLAPEDGGRTASERPTFYWYLPNSNNFPYKTIFELRDPSDKDGNVVFKTEGTANKSGLYRLALPTSSPALKPEKVYIWQLRLRGSNASSNLQAVGSIVLTKIEGDMQKAIAKTDTKLEKAKIYSKNGYWFDALNIYTTEIEAAPKDQTGYRLRAEMMYEIFNRNDANPEAIASVKNLVEKINSSSTTETLIPKN